MQISNALKKLHQKSNKKNTSNILKNQEKHKLKLYIRMLCISNGYMIRSKK